MILPPDTPNSCCFKPWDVLNTKRKPSFRSDLEGQQSSSRLTIPNQKCGTANWNPGGHPGKSSPTPGSNPVAKPRACFKPRIGAPYVFCKALEFSSPHSGRFRDFGAHVWELLKKCHQKNTKSIKKNTHLGRCRPFSFQDCQSITRFFNASNLPSRSAAKRVRALQNGSHKIELKPLNICQQEQPISRLQKRVQYLESHKEMEINVMVHDFVKKNISYSLI